MLKLIFLLVPLVFACGSSLYAESEHVIELVEQTFDFVVNDRLDVWALLFYSAEDEKSKNAVQQYERAAKMLKGLVTFGAINLDHHPVLGHRLNCKKLPSVTFMNRERTLIPYTGPLTDAGVIEFAKEVIVDRINFGLQKRFSDNRAVQQMTEKEVKQLAKNGNKFWLVAYYSSDADNTTEEFKEMVEFATDKLGEAINVGAFDVSTEDPPIKYRTLPLLMLYHGKKSDRFQLEYTGKYDGQRAVDFVMNRIKAPQIKELWTENVLADLCSPKKYCIITFIPSVASCDDDCKNKYKSVLAEVAEEYKTVSAVWAMIRKDVMKFVEKLLEIDDTVELPISVIVDVKTLKTEYIADSFGVQAVKAMISDALSGDGFAGKSIPVFDHLPQYKPWVRDEL